MLALRSGICVVLGLFTVSSMAQTRAVSAKELLENGAQVLSAEELRQLARPGSTMIHVAPSTGNWRTWTNREDGTFVIVTRYVNASFNMGSSGTGIWLITPDGRYCANITWQAETEKWCRAVWRYKGGLYSAPLDLGKAGTTMYGLIEIR
jgi:hypothetical protein